jgi:hypothetical protein
MKVPNGMKVPSSKTPVLRSTSSPGDFGTSTTDGGQNPKKLLRPLPYPEADRIVSLYERNPHLGFENASVSPANYVDWREQNRVFEEIGFVGEFAASRSFILTGADSTRRPFRPTRTPGDRSGRRKCCRRKASFAGKKSIHQPALRGGDGLWKDFRQSRPNVWDGCNPVRPSLGTYGVRASIAAADSGGAFTVAGVQDRRGLPIKLSYRKRFHSRHFVGVRFPRQVSECASSPAVTAAATVSTQDMSDFVEALKRLSVERGTFMRRVKPVQRFNASTLQRFNQP